MPIRSPMQPGAFEPEVIAAMSEAFEAARQALQDGDLSEGVREQIARQIITAAKLVSVTRFACAPLGLLACPAKSANRRLPPRPQQH